MWIMLRARQGIVNESHHQDRRSVTMRQLSSEQDSNSAGVSVLSTLPAVTGGGCRRPRVT
jgi:hypothetical protein